MTLYSASITLILLMDPLGNIPFFISILNSVEEKRRGPIIVRESFFAFLVLAIFLFAGEKMLNSLNITQPALGMAGGIILFLISIKMIFPSSEHEHRERVIGEPFVVPLAIPLLAGPSALATVLLFSAQDPDKIWLWFAAIAIASFVSAIILLFANRLKKVLGQKGLVALERLMGMVLTTIAVQMFLSGTELYIKTLRQIL